VRSRAFWRDSFEFWVLSFGFCVALGGARVSNPRAGSVFGTARMCCTQNSKPKTQNPKLESVATRNGIP
jgi:hypothetical protein